MADQAAVADLAADVAVQVGLLTALRKTKVALNAFRAVDESSEEEMRPCTTVDAPGPGGMTALLVACLQGTAADAEFLLGCGADPTAEGDVWEVAQPGLVERKKWKAFPLYIAARESSKGDGHEAVVKMLLSHAGVDVNQGTTDSGATALYIACEWGSLRVVKMLLACDAIDVNQARTDAGGTPLYSACYEGRTEIVEMLLARDEIEVNQATTDDGASPLYIACDQGRAEIVAMLLARDAIDVNQATTDDGATPLCIACYHGRAEIVAMLLARDVIDVNKAKTDDGITPLHAAANNGHLLAAQLLVAYGARLTATDIDNETPAQVATAQGHPVLAEWLTAVAGWSQLRVAAGCRLHKDAALLLRRGKVEPGWFDRRNRNFDDPYEWSVQDTMQLLATAKAKPSALPWQNAPPICKATIKLVADATRGWHRTTHWLHHTAVRDAVFAVLVVAQRLQTKDALSVEPPSDALADADVEAAAAAAAAAAATATVPSALPLLPIEIWLFAMRFFQRSWWCVWEPHALPHTLASKIEKVEFSNADNLAHAGADADDDSAVPALLKGTVDSVISVTCEISPSTEGVRNAEMEIEMGDPPMKRVTLNVGCTLAVAAGAATCVGTLTLTAPDPNWCPDVNYEAIYAGANLTKDRFIELVFVNRDDIQPTLSFAVDVHDGGATVSEGEMAALGGPDELLQAGRLMQRPSFTKRGIEQVYNAFKFGGGRTVSPDMLDSIGYRKYPLFAALATVVMDSLGPW